MKYLKITAVFLFVSLCVLAYTYIDRMVSYKFEVDLMKTHVEVSSSSPEEKNNKLEQIEIKGQNILRTKRIIVILLFVCLSGLSVILYCLCTVNRTNKYR